MKFWKLTVRSVRRLGGFRRLGHTCHILSFQPILWNRCFPSESAKSAPNSPKSISEGGRLWQVWRSLRVTPSPSLRGIPHGPRNSTPWDRESASVKSSEIQMCSLWTDRNPPSQARPRHTAEASNNRWTRNPRPQLEPQITSLEDVSLTKVDKTHQFTTFLGLGSGVPIPSLTRYPRVQLLLLLSLLSVMLL